MAYTPENNPYIPGDPYSYDLKWMVKDIKHMEERFGELDSQVQEATDQADRSRDEADRSDAEALKSEGFAVGEQDGAAVDPDSPYYENNAKFYAEKAQLDGHTEALKSEGFAIGEQDGTPVGSGSPYYENNGKFFAQEAAASEQAAANYAAHIADPVSGLVTDWLNTHITQPTTPVVDDTLTISGAAADAAAAGAGISKNKTIAEDAFNAIRSQIVVDTSSEISATDTLTDSYIMPDGNIASYNHTRIKLYPVNRGNSYFVSGITGLQVGNYPLIAFSDTNAPTSVEILKTTGPVNLALYPIDFIYHADRDGFIAICEVDVYYNTNFVLKVYDYDSELSIKYSGLSDELNSIYQYKGGTVKSPDFTEAERFISDNHRMGTVSASQFSLKYYKVSAGDSIIVKGRARLANNIYPIAVFADSNQTWTDLIVPATTAATLTDYETMFTAPTDGFVVICVLALANYGELNAYTPSMITDLKLQAFGDSITDNANNTWAGHVTWLDYIERAEKEKYDLTIVNSAYGGCYLSQHDANCVVNQVTNQLDISANVAVVFGGTNDWANAVSIGTLSSDDTTIKGAVKKIIDTISSTAQDTMLIFCTPIQRYAVYEESWPTNANGEVLNSAGLTLKDYCEAIQSVCDLYGIPCIRLDKLAGFNKFNIRHWASDGLHPQKPGSVRLASIIGSEIDIYFK